MVERFEHPSGLIVYRNENGQKHREDGPAGIFPDGRKEWYKNGKLHRDDGPAIISPSGRKVWWLNGEIHRDDGPAGIFPDGRKYWYLNGVHYTFDKWIELVNISKEEKMELVLRYG